METTTEVKTEAETRKQCYGAMFPDVLHPDQDTPVSGKVFSFELRRAGGLFRSGRSYSTRIDEWDDCVRCPEFEHCYRLSMAKITLQTAIEDQ